MIGLVLGKPEFARPSFLGLNTLKLAHRLTKQSSTPLPVLSSPIALRQQNRPVRTTCIETLTFLIALG